MEATNLKINYNMNKIILLLMLVTTFSLSGCGSKSKTKITVPANAIKLNPEIFPTSNKQVMITIRGLDTSSICEWRKYEMDNSKMEIFTTKLMHGNIYDTPSQAYISIFCEEQNGNKYYAEEISLENFSDFKPK